MEISYDKIYLKVERPKRAQVVPVAIPMYMYRIEVNSYEHGLNFLQKQVLRLKAKPEFSEEKIGALIGINPSVIRRVVSELENKRLLDGGLTESGREKLQELDGLVVNAGERKLGYVFQFVDSGRIYPWVVHDLQIADLGGESDMHPSIVDFTKGDSEREPSPVVYFDSMWRGADLFPSPTERDITKMILNTAKRSEDEDSAAGRSLGVRLLEESPTKVWVCTYVFLPKIDGQHIYHSEWKTLDPFGHGDAHELDGSSADMRYYLNAVDDGYLKTEIQRAFDWVETQNGKKRADYVQELNERIKDRIELDFPSFVGSDRHIMEGTKDVVKGLIEWEDGQSKDQRLILDICVGIIRTMETILSIDAHERSVNYQSVLEQCGTDHYSWKRMIQTGFEQNFGEELSNLWWYTKTKQTWPKAFRFSKSQFENSNGFSPKIWAFVATTSEPGSERLVRAFRGRLSALHKINGVRNQTHGTTERDEKQTSISKEEGQHFYETFMSIMTQYLSN